MTVFDAHTHQTKSVTMPLADGDIHVRQDGPGDAPALLLIHGSATSLRSWYALVPLLAGTHRVVRIDLLGHGRSDKPAEGRYEIPAQARRVGTVLDRLDIPRAAVAGHSSGGYTATALAEERPELVTGLALINTGPNSQAFIAPDSAAPGPSQWPPDDAQLKEFARSGYGRADHPVPPQLLDDVRAMTYQSFVSTMRASHEYLEQRTIPQRLAALATPVLAIFGEDDRRWRAADSVADYRTVPGAAVETLPEVGHSPIMEDPSRTAALLLAFAAGHRVT